MKSQDLSSKCLDTAIKTMERNRALLFAINLLAALLLVIVYLENFSFDKALRDGHLIRYQQRCGEVLNSLINTLSPEEVDNLKGCADLEKMRGAIVAKTTDTKLLSELSQKMLSLHILHNEMEDTKLDLASLTPLGFGLAVPRNDLVFICGVLLLTLYTWLAFSFKQLVGNIIKIETLFPDAASKRKSKGEMPPNNKETQFHLNDLIEMNFLFRTSTPEKSRWLVKALYWSAPAAMTLAVLNNTKILFDSSPYIKNMTGTLVIQFLVQGLLAICLWILGINVNKSDNKASVSEKKPIENPSNNDS